MFFFIFGIRSLVSFESFVEGGVFDPRDIVSGHDGELHVAHCIAAAVGSEVFFDFSQPMPAARQVRVAASRTVLTSLLSDMVVYICVKNIPPPPPPPHMPGACMRSAERGCFSFFYQREVLETSLRWRPT